MKLAVVCKDHSTRRVPMPPFPSKQLPYTSLVAAITIHTQQDSGRVKKHGQGHIGHFTVAK